MKKRSMITMISAAAMTLTMAGMTSMNAMAVTMPDNSKGVVVSSTTSGDYSSLTFKKDIVVHNEDTNYSGNVIGPVIKYNYQIAPVTVTSAKVKDASGNEQNVTSGVANAVSFTSTGADNQAVFNGASVQLTGGKATVSDNVTVVVDATKFAGAGIYRYKITESVDTTTPIDGAGVTRDTDKYSDDRYLDIYVQNGTSGLEVYAYVMFHSSTATPGDTSFAEATSTDPAVNVDQKTIGYDGDDTSSSSSTTPGFDDPVQGDMADHYYTFNYTLTKSITGTLADKTHKFPFQIEVSSEIGKSKSSKEYAITKTGEPTAPDTFTLDADGKATIGDLTNTKLAIADAQAVTLYGLPVDATVKVTEKNDTDDKYKSNYQNTTGDASAVTDVAKDGTYGFSSALNLTDYASNNNTKTKPNTEDTTFTNNLPAVSPTGVAMAVAPFAIMGGAAVGFVLLASRNRKKDESATI
ncbi:MAG: QVPTGV class sortase B protein-sorting domain-containing protein [Ruminococcus sp.]|nr:QVPTGV class sortase B protein-sorting domain-containing protein [Ruminococcus sp.]